jgi:hypothetical protein
VWTYCICPKYTSASFLASVSLQHRKDVRIFMSLLHKCVLLVYWVLYLQKSMVLLNRLCGHTCLTHKPHNPALHALIFLVNCIIFYGTYENICLTFLTSDLQHSFIFYVYISLFTVQSALQIMHSSVVPHIDTTDPSCMHSSFIIHQPLS